MGFTAWQQDACEDAALLSRAADGDESAFETLYRCYAPSCLGLATAVLRDEALAQEAVQEAFLQLWLQAADFDTLRCTVGGWLHTLVRRRAIDKVRSQSRRRVLSLEFVTDIGDPSQDPSIPALNAAMADVAVRALRLLSAPQRRTVVLAYWGGYTMSEIASMEQAPLGTIKTRCRAGLAQLRLVLGNRDSDDIFLAEGQTVQAS